MSKKKPIITIDFNKECTVADYAIMKGITTQRITNWIARDQIKYRIIPELNGLKLVTIDSEVI